MTIHSIFILHKVNIRCRIAVLHKCTYDMHICIFSLKILIFYCSPPPLSFEENEKIKFSVVSGSGLNLLVPLQRRNWRIESKFAITCKARPIEAITRYILMLPKRQAFPSLKYMLITFEIYF